MPDPFAPPAQAAGIKWADLHGALLLIDVHTLETGITTAFGDTDAVRADITVIDGDHQGDTYPDALIFPRALQAQLRPRVGLKVLGRLGQGTAKAGQSPPWLLAEATETDRQAGLAWLASVFATPAADEKAPW